MKNNIKIAIVLGTRPEIIKMSPIIRYCEEQKVDYFILHTGQHYSYEMDKQMFEDLDLPQPKYNLNVGSQEYRKQVGIMIHEIMNILEKEQPSILLVQGDTNTVLAGALAANKKGIPIGHHEAGLRSHDITMLEETNRIITDHIADFLYAPTESAVKNLEEEGIKKHIKLTGNTIVDAVQQNLALANKKVDILKKLKLPQKEYIIVTAHRAENVDKKTRLADILEGLRLVGETLHISIIFPMHPRTKKRIEEFNLTVPEVINVIEPLGFLEFLQLEANAKLIITDSGGLQEEACILKVPCVTIRDNTERPETIASGANLLAGTSPVKILDCSISMLNKETDWKNPFGDGNSGKYIVDHIMKVLAR